MRASASEAALSDEQTSAGGSAIIVVAALVHAAAVVALFPAMQLRIADEIGIAPLPLLLASLPTVSLTALYARARLGEKPGHLTKRLSGGVFGMLATFLTLAVLLVWQVDLTSLPLFAFSTDPTSFDGFPWFVGFGVLFPTMMGIFLDDGVYKVGRPLLRVPGIVAALIIVLFGIGLGAGAVALFASRAVDAQVEGAAASYWETLGEGWGVLVPILVGAAITIIVSSRSKD